MKAGKERSGQRYRLVADRGGQPALLGTLRLDGRGRGAVPLDLDRPLLEYQQFRVRGAASGAGGNGPALWGSSGPTGTPVAAGTAQPNDGAQR